MHVTDQLSVRVDDLSPDRGDDVHCARSPDPYPARRAGDVRVDLLPQGRRGGGAHRGRAGVLRPSGTEPKTQAVPGSGEPVTAGDLPGAHQRAAQHLTGSAKIPPPSSGCPAPLQARRSSAVVPRTRLPGCSQIAVATYGLRVSNWMTRVSRQVDAARECALSPAAQNTTVPRAACTAEADRGVRTGP